MLLGESCIFTNPVKLSLLVPRYLGDCLLCLPDCKMRLMALCHYSLGTLGLLNSSVQGLIYWFTLFAAVINVISSCLLDTPPKNIYVNSSYAAYIRIQMSQKWALRESTLQTLT